VDRKTRTNTDKDLSAASAGDKEPRKGGWQEIEARREKAALKASLADVWDEDFDLDEEVLADLDHNAEFFTSQQDEEEDLEGDGEEDEFFEEDPI
jgi:hypothetical protein